MVKASPLHEVVSKQSSKLKRKRPISQSYNCIDLSSVTFYPGSFVLFMLTSPSALESDHLRVQISAIFYAPPWGGLSYLKDADFSLSANVPLSRNDDVFHGTRVLEMCHKLVPYVCSYLPRSLVLPKNIEALVRDIEQVQVESAWIEHIYVSQRKESIVALLHTTKWAAGTSSTI